MNRVFMLIRIMELIFYRYLNSESCCPVLVEEGYLLQRLFQAYHKQLDFCASWRDEETLLRPYLLLTGWMVTYFYILVVE